jgi:hypothetical protein
MPLLEALRLALQAIWSSKLRSFFTLLGIIVSVGFLVVVVAIIQGMNAYVSDTLTASMIGTNTFQVRRGPISIGLLDDDQIRAIAKDLATSLATIRKKAPHAKVVLVGYPRVAPDSGSCGSPGQSDARFPVPAAQLVRLRDTLAFVNQVWSETAKQAGVLYVDMYDASEGHDICSDDPWINGYLPVPGKAIGLHPLPVYMKVVAEKIADLVGNV